MEYNSEKKKILPKDGKRYRIFTISLYTNWDWSSIKYHNHLQLYFGIPESIETDSWLLSVYTLSKFFLKKLGKKNRYIRNSSPLRIVLEFILTSLNLSAIGRHVQYVSPITVTCWYLQCRIYKAFRSVLLNEILLLCCFRILNFQYWITFCHEL